MLSGKTSSSSSSSIGATNLSWVSACSTVAEHSQQEGFTECRCQRHVKTAIWRRTKDLERSSFRHKRPPASEATLANPRAEGGTMGEKWPRILPKVATERLVRKTKYFIHISQFAARDINAGSPRYYSVPLQTQRRRCRI
jgi:hypothetical protein